MSNFLKKVIKKAGQDMKTGKSKQRSKLKGGDVLVTVENHGQQRSERRAPTQGESIK